jgi:hypothetical protein
MKNGVFWDWKPQILQIIKLVLINNDFLKLPIKIDCHTNNAYKLSSYLKRNTLLRCYEDRPPNAVTETF